MDYSIWMKLKKQLLLVVAEIKQLLAAGTRLDWLSLDFGDIGGLLDLMFEEGTDGERHIDFILSTKLLVAIFDKVLNLETDALGLRAYYTEVLNTFIPDLGISLLEGFEVTEELLTLRGITNEAGIFDTNELVKLLQIARLFDFSAFSVDVHGRVFSLR
jgi:hypothetical protein